MSLVERLRNRAAPQLSLSEMRRRDLGQVIRIEQQWSSRPWSRQVFETEVDLIATGTRCYLVARRGRQVVGYAGLWINGSEAHVTNIAVDEPYRRHRIATALLAELARRAIARNCTAWTLEVRVSSVGAQALYRRFGFVPAGIRTGYYENREDALIMWCHDIDTDRYAALIEEIIVEDQGCGHVPTR